MSSAKHKKGAAAKQPLLPLVKDTEVEAYEFIRRGLRDLGWIVKNPSLNTGGQVWTQNQCLSHLEIKFALDKKRPENIVKISESSIWVIEAKASRNQLALAVDEAVNYYADRINNCAPKLRAILASGVAGTEESGYLIRTKIFVDGTWKPVTINQQEATGLLSPQDVQTLLEQKASDIHEFSPPPPNGYSFRLPSGLTKSSTWGALTRMTAPRR